MPSSTLATEIAHFPPLPHGTQYSIGHWESEIKMSVERLATIILYVVCSEEDENIIYIFGGKSQSSDLNTCTFK